MKYIKEVQQHATFLPTAAIPCSTADILVLLTSLSGSFINQVSISVNCPFNTWWGRWGPCYLQCNYGKQFGKLPSYDRHSCRHPGDHAGPQGARKGPTTAAAIDFNTCTWPNFSGPVDKKTDGAKGVLERHSWRWRDCRCTKAFLFCLLYSTVQLSDVS